MLKVYIVIGRNMVCNVANLLRLSLLCTVVDSQPVVDYYSCPGEEQSLICSTKYTLLEWRISTINQTLREIRSVPYEGQNPTIIPILINSATFTFLKASSQNALPLVSTMTIVNINNDLEGTMISCTGINSSSVSSVVLMKVLHVFNVNIDVPNPPNVSVRTDMIHFGNDNFTVTLEWPQFSGETYTVTTAPEALHANFTTNSSVQLVMLYNVQYNVNVIATLCGHRNTTNSTMIHYGKCKYPAPREDMAAFLSHSQTEGPWIEGSIVTYNCSPGLKVIESNMSTCIDNGQWEPDPMDITCAGEYDPDLRAICGQPPSPRNGYIYPYSNSSLRVIVICYENEKEEIAKCHLNGTWQPNPSDLCDSDNESLSDPEIKHATNLNVYTATIISSVLCSTFFFIFGLICGQITRLFQKREKSPLHHDYEVVPIRVPSIAISQEVHQEVNFQQNEAYAQITHT